MPFATKESYNNWKRSNYLKHREKELMRKKEYYATDKGKEILYKSIDAYRKRFPEKQRARRILQYHLRKGRIIKSLCKCGVKDVQAHHPDYSKPLEVVWLCSFCHGLKHRKCVKWLYESWKQAILDVSLSRQIFTPKFECLSHSSSVGRALSLYLSGPRFDS